jgi:hypothetical protein
MYPKKKNVRKIQRKVCERTTILLKEYISSSNWDHPIRQKFSSVHWHEEANMTEESVIAAENLTVNIHKMNDNKDSLIKNSTN